MKTATRTLLLCLFLIFSQLTRAASDPSQAKKWVTLSWDQVFELPTHIRFQARKVDPKSYALPKPKGQWWIVELVFHFPAEKTGIRFDINNGEDFANFYFLENERRILPIAYRSAETGKEAGEELEFLEGKGSRTISYGGPNSEFKIWLVFDLPKQAEPNRAFHANFDAGWQYHWLKIQ